MDQETYDQVRHDCMVDLKVWWGPPDCLCMITPLVVDVAGGHPQLTSAADGVLFDIGATGKVQQVAWTTPGSKTGFLVLDRNGDGLINNGSELFGSATPMAAAISHNGFQALAEFDGPLAGGNNDGLIDEKDLVYSKLRLWIDTNHDGRSTPAELFPLPAVDIYSISLDFQTSSQKDQFGNILRFKAVVNEGRNSGRAWMYDVALAMVNPAPQADRAQKQSPASSKNGN